MLRSIYSRWRRDGGEETERTARREVGRRGARREEEIAQLNGEGIISLYGHSRVKRDRGDGGDVARNKGTRVSFAFSPSHANERAKDETERTRLSFYMGKKVRFRCVKSGSILQATPWAARHAPASSHWLHAIVLKLNDEADPLALSRVLARALPTLSPPFHGTPASFLLFYCWLLPPLDPSCSINRHLHACHEPYATNCR